MHNLNAPFARKQAGFSIPMLIGIIGLVAIVGFAAAKFSSGTKMDVSPQEAKAAASTLQMQKGQLSSTFAMLQAETTGDWTEFGQQNQYRTAALAKADGSLVTDPTKGHVWPVGPKGADGNPIVWKAAASLPGTSALFAYTSENVPVAVCVNYNGGGALVDLSSETWTEAQLVASTFENYTIPNGVVTALFTDVPDSACVKTNGGHRVVARLR